MTYQLTIHQANVLLESLDIAVKKLGLAGVYKVAELDMLLRNPVAQDEETVSYEFTETNIAEFKDALDIVVKERGVTILPHITDVLNALDAPAAAEAEPEA